MDRNQELKDKSRRLRSSQTTKAAKELVNKIIDMLTYGTNSYGKWMNIIIKARKMHLFYAKLFENEIQSKSFY